MTMKKLKSRRGNSLVYSFLAFEMWTRDSTQIRSSTGSLISGNTTTLSNNSLRRSPFAPSSSSSQQPVRPWTRCSGPLGTSLGSEPTANTRRTPPTTLSTGSDPLWPEFLPPLPTFFSTEATSSLVLTQSQSVLWDPRRRKQQRTRRIKDQQIWYNATTIIPKTKKEQSGTEENLYRIICRRRREGVIWGNKSLTMVTIAASGSNQIVYNERILVLLYRW